MNISVIIPLYNAEAFIAKTIDSCLQFEEVKEIIVVDDGYEDNARSIVENYAKQHAHIKIFQHPHRENRGAGASRNLGLKKATQDYIAFLDADDFYLPNRFTKDKKIFAQHNDADGCYNALGVYFYSEEAKKIFLGHFRDITTVSEKTNPTPENLFKGLSGMIRGYGYFSLDCLTIKRKELLKHNLWFNEQLMVHQDTDFLIRLAYYCKLYPAEISEPTAKRGVHGNNRITENFEKSRVAKQKNRYKQWLSLYNWANEQTFDDPGILPHFKNRLIRHKLGKQVNPKIRLLLKEIRQNPMFLKSKYYPPIHTLYFKKLGRYPRAGLFRLRNLMIRFY